MFMAENKEESSSITVTILTTEAMEKDAYIFLLLEGSFLVFTNSKKECVVGVLRLYQSINDTRRLFRIWEMGQLFKYMILSACLWYTVLSISRSWNKKNSSQCNSTLGSFTSGRLFHTIKSDLKVSLPQIQFKDEQRCNAMWSELKWEPTKN